MKPAQKLSSGEKQTAQVSQKELELVILSVELGASQH